MERKAVVGIMFMLLLLSMFSAVFSINTVRADGTIYISLDGVYPATAPIQRDGNVYTFTDNIYDSIVVGGNNIIIDGNGYTLQSTGNDVGFTLNGNDITIKNTVITKFDLPGASFAAAIYSFDTSNNIITNNTITSNKWGINLEWVTGYIISDNTIAHHSQAGIYMRECRNNKIYHNNFIDNRFTYGVQGTDNTWDDGYPSGGNYWSDYDGVDEKTGPNQDDPGSDGIGDTPYHSDRYPLMNPRGLPPSSAAEKSIFEQVWFWTIVIAGIVILFIIALFAKRIRTKSK